MLQKWKRKGKRFRHVEKDGEETTELSVKIRAAKFRDLPMSLRILIVNLSLFLILCAVFFMAGGAARTRSLRISPACRRLSGHRRGCMRRRRQDGITWKHAWQETGTVHTMYVSSQTARFCRGRTTSMQ